MSTVEARIAQRPFPCPWCPEVVEVGDVIWPLKVGTTESSACASCAWKAENNIPLFREAPTRPEEKP